MTTSGVKGNLDCKRVRSIEWDSKSSAGECHMIRRSTTTHVLTQSTRFYPIPFHAFLGAPMPLSNSDGCLLETASTVAPPPLPVEVTADTGRGGGGGGGGFSTNNVNPNASRARGINIGAGGGGGASFTGRKGNANNNTSNNNINNRQTSQSSAGTIATIGGAGASRLNIDGGDFAEEEVESTLDARCT